MNSKLKSKPPVEQPRLVRRCPKCNCGRWRNVGEIASVGVSTSGKVWREISMKIVECMKCGYSWDILDDDSENITTNAKSAGTDASEKTL